MVEPQSPTQGALAFARSRGWFSTLDVQALLEATGEGEPQPGPTAFAAALVEGALLAASADRALERPELDALAGLLQALTGRAGDRDELAGVVYAFAALARKQGREARL